MQLVAYKILVKGKVQGVSYRQYTKNKAQELGITGYVRNLPNGDVEIVAIGDPSVVQNLIDWCHYGSPKAEVNDVIVESIAVDSYPNFSIRY